MRLQNSRFRPRVSRQRISNLSRYGTSVSFTRINRVDRVDLIIDHQNCEKRRVDSTSGFLPLVRARARSSTTFKLRVTNLSL
jgi:hypothetical protein